MTPSMDEVGCLLAVVFAETITHDCGNLSSAMSESDAKRTHTEHDRPLMGRSTVDAKIAVQVFGATRPPIFTMERKRP